MTTATKPAKPSLFRAGSAPVAPAPVAPPANLVPAGLLTPPKQPVIGGGASVPYVQFYHPMSPKAADLAAMFPGIKEGEEGVILHRPDGKPTRIKPFSFFLLDFHQFDAKFASDGALIAAKPASGRYSEGWKDTIDTALVILTLEGLIPACCRFAGVRTDVARFAAGLLAAVETPEWMAKSHAHAQAAAMPYTQFRAFTMVGWQTRQAKSTGRLLTCTTGTEQPIGPADAAKVLDWISQPETHAAIAAVKDDFARRVAEVQAKMPK